MFELTPARLLLLSRTPQATNPSGFPMMTPNGTRTIAAEGFVVAAAAVVMATATTANVIRHWNDRI